MDQHPLHPGQVGFTIRSIEAILVDLPTIREHRLANQTLARQTLVVLRVLTEEGLEGLGEGTAIGGLSYGPEAPETIKAALDTYVAPLLVGRSFAGPGPALALIDRHVKGNSLAKSALDIALHDIAAKALGVPVSALYGGARTERLEVAWGLATGDASREIEEAQGLFAAGRHRLFKVKVGAAEVDQDVARVAAIAAALGPGARIRIDANQAWDEPTARRTIVRMAEAGVELVEQPMARHDTAAMARLARRSPVPLMADEAVSTPADAFDLAARRACDAFALKLAKSGGLAGAARVAAVAEAAGIGLYGGTMLEGTIGTLAAAHLFAALPQPFAWGTELFGPLLLRDDIVTARPRYGDFAIAVPPGPGLGVEIDEDKLAFYRRDRTRTPVAFAAQAAA